MTRMTRATYAGSLLLVALDFALFALAFALLLSALLVRRIKHRRTGAVGCAG